MLLIAAFLVLATPTTPADHIAAGERALEALEYETAAYELMLAATDPHATDAEKHKANLLAGEAHRILGRDTEARLNFRYVLLRAPGTRLADDTPPKVRLFFESVRQEIVAEQELRAPLPPPPPSSQPAPGPPPPAPAPPETAEPGSGLALAGGATIGVGALALVGGAATAAFAETSLADGTRPYDERRAIMELGLAGLTAASAGVIIAAVGGVLLAAGSAP